jgi:hypothetical protein
LHSSDSGEKEKRGYSHTVHQVFIDLKRAHDSVGREIMYSILIGFDMPMKLVRLIKMCVNET